MKIFHQDIDGNYVGKLEKGKIRCPREEHRRLALRRVLGVMTDVDLGFTPFRRSRIDPSNTSAGPHGSSRLQQSISSADSVSSTGGSRASGHHSAAAFFGHGVIVVATPLKREAIRARPVVAIEDVTGAQRLGDLIRSLNLQPKFESIPADGRIDLNRENLIVICGPRISDQVARLLAQDARFQFIQTNAGHWTLTDQQSGTIYRSGQDEDPPGNWDVAYLGRLARPDGKGSLLIFTGIHPQGSLGVVHLLCSHLPEIYAETGGDLFSVLVRTEYDEVTQEPNRIELLTSIYHPGEA
jgi:hypothetical protein